MSQIEIERLGRAIQQAHGDLLEAPSVAEAGKNGGMSTGGPHWPERGKGSRARPRIGRQMLKPKKNNNYFSLATSAQEARVAEEKRNRELYGDALEDVEFLRRCGWAINVLCGGYVMFGNQPISLDELRAKAERERRLRQPAAVVALA
jgi:hypothetical protein